MSVNTNIKVETRLSKSIHIDIWISRPGAYAYKIEYEPLPQWDPLGKIPDDLKKVTKVNLFWVLANF